MFDHHWAGLNPPQKMLLLLLVVSAISGVVSVLLLSVKLFIEFGTRQETRKLVKLAHDVLLADAQLRQEISRKATKVEQLAEGTALAVREVKKTSEEVKHVVRTAAADQAVANRDAAGARATPRPPE